MLLLVLHLYGWWRLLLLLGLQALTITPVLTLLLLLWKLQVEVMWARSGQPQQAQGHFTTAVQTLLLLLGPI